MTGLIPETKPIVTSIENEARDRCVDFVLHADGTVTYREFRRDPEDAGRWSLVSDYGAPRHACMVDAVAHASRRIAWLAEIRESSTSRPSA